MNRTILYYPTIKIPQQDWLRHALLYWDQVSSIIPDDHKINNTLPRHIDYLTDMGEFRAIRPEELYYGHNWDILEQFTAEFCEIVSAPEFQRHISRTRNIIRPSQIHVRNLGMNGLSRIHENKTTDFIYQFLRDQDLVYERHYGDDNWIYFEKNTALLYMSLLAKYLANVDKNHVTIGTDLATYENFNFKKVSKERGFPVVSVNLNSVLPTPNPNISIGDIVKFKRDYRENLLHFRKKLSDFHSSVSKAKTQAELKEQCANFGDEIKMGVKDLAKAMKSSKLEYRLKSLKSLIGLKSPTTWLTALEAANTALHILPVAFPAAAVGIATVGAIELATNYVENRNKTAIKFAESPFSYIHKAREFGIVKKI